MVNEALLSLFAVWSFYTDARYGKIPNRLTLSLAVCGLLCNGIGKGWTGIVDALTGMAVVLPIMLILYAFGALGAGDAKFFAAMGALAGLDFAVGALMYSILYAGVLGLAILVMNRAFMQRIAMYFYRLFCAVLFRNAKHLRCPPEKSKLIRFPFMYAALPGIMTCMFHTIN